MCSSDLLPLQKGAGNVRSSVYNLAEAPLTPAWHKKIDDLAALRKRGGDVEGRAKYCIFLGFPGGMAGPRSIHEFLLAPGLVLVTDATGFVRRIYTDGRKHHVGPPTMWGDSIGHWEGQTLVVDTVGMQAGNEIEYGLPGGKNMHVVERIYLKPGNPDYMIIDEVLDAPQAFSMPYKFSTEYSKHPAGNPDDKLIEFDCAQNNRDLNDNGVLGGRQQLVGASLLWVPTDYVRFIVDYGHLWLKDAAVAAGADQIGRAHG